MKKRQLLSILLLAPLVLICGQSRVIEFSLEGFHPTHQVTGKKGVLIKVESTHVPNLLKQYDANPFNKPVITSADGMQQNLYSVFTDYVSGIGMDPRSESENQIQLKTILCSINYLSGRGWTATAKFEIEISRNNMVLLHQSIGAYEVEGGNDKDIYLGEKVINRALFNAFESFNWESVADKLSDDRTNSADAQSPADQYTPVFSTHPQNDHATLQNTGRYYALLIAIEDYKYINKLDKPIGDATQLYNILSSSYGFHREDIFFLKNPDRAQIIDKLDFLVSTIKEDDNLLIFYAGHGYWDEERQTGYWLPADAKKSSTANWLRNSTIQEYIGDIRSKHTLLIADACFGGGIFNSQ